MKKNRKHFLILCLFLLSTSFVACDAAIEEEAASGVTPTASIASQIGPISQFITDDTFNIADEISENTVVALQEIYNFQAPEDPDVIAFTTSANRFLQIFDDLNTATTTEQFAVEDVALALTDVTASVNDWPGLNCDESGECDCTFGGTRTYTGDLDVTVRLDTGAGNISGDYSVIYSNCIEIVELETSDSTCNVYVDVSGTISNTLNIDFSNFIDPRTLDNTNLSTRDIRQTTDNFSSLQFSTSGGIDGPFTEAEDIDFDFIFDFSESSANVEPDRIVSTLTFDSVEYNIGILADFIEDSISTDVCP